MLKKIKQFTPLEKQEDNKKSKTMGKEQKFIKKSNILNSLTGFIKYNTFTVVVIAVAFVAVASVMAANDDVKKIIGEEIVEKSGVDNSVLLAADLENFDLKMEITGAMEDEENYYVDYQYNTLAIKDNVWQEVLIGKQMTVSKASLDGRDLGLYVMEELGEIIDYQLAFLKEVQEKENEKGVTVVLETTKYTKLIGLVFDTKTKKMPGYEPVVKPPVVEETQETTPTPPSQGGDDYDDFTGTPVNSDYPADSYYYQFLINNCLSNSGYWYNGTCNAEAEIVETSQEGSTQSMEPTDPVDTPVCDVDNLDLCIDQSLCEGANLFWYGEVCNSEEESSSAPQPSGTMEPADDTSVCDADNLDLCITKELCEEIGLYWYDEICNSEEEVVAEVFTCDADHPALCDAEEICVEMGLYWYGEECHLGENKEGATNVTE